MLLVSGLLSSVSQGEDLAPYDYEHFFDPSRLVKVDIQIAEADWNVLRMQHRSLLRTLRTDVPPSKQEKQFTYFEGNLTIDGTDLGKVAVRKKGFIGSMDQRRPSFKIQVDRFDKKKSFATVDTITLNNNKQDPTRVSQVVGYGVFRDAGLPASRCNLALVTLNGESLGIYSNVESLDKRFARRQFGNADGALYEGTLADFEEDSLVRFERKFGKKKRDKKLAQAAAALKADDDELLEKLGSVLDLERFYRFWALEGLLGHWDGYVSNKNNYFVYYDAESERLHFIPWGMDQLGEDNNVFWGQGFRAPISVKADGAIARRLYRNEDVRDAYFATVKDIFKTVWNEDELLSQIEGLEALIDGHRVSFGRDRRRSGKKLKEFIPGRRADVEAEIEEGYPEWTLGPRDTPDRVEKQGECEIEFAFKMPKLNAGENRYVKANGDGGVKLTLDDQDVGFDSAEIALKLNRGRRGPSVSLQITRPNAKDGTPSTIEVTFPYRKHEAGDPYRIDAFASPAQGRLLDRRGNAGRDEGRGAIAGYLTLAEFGDDEGDQVRGNLKGEFYAFIPRE
jgi:hypothetical protein